MLLHKGFSMLLLWLRHITLLTLFLGACVGGELSETDSLINFIQAIDPINSLGISRNGSLPNPCSGQWMGVKCNLETNNITEIVLENSNLTGWIDANSLCKLPSLQVLTLAKNLIVGSIPDAISNCRSMTHLNLSSNSLQGRVPASLSNLKNLRSLDVSHNNLSGPLPNFSQGVYFFFQQTLELRADKNYVNDSIPVGKKMNNDMKTQDLHLGDVGLGLLGTSNDTHSMDSLARQRQESSLHSERKNPGLSWVYICLPIVAVIACIIFIVRNKTCKEVLKKNPERLRECSESSESPIKILTAEAKEDSSRQEEEESELMFFIEEHEKFEIEELLGSTAHLQGQSLFSSLYKVRLKNDNVYVVKRLKKLQVSKEEFRRTMTRIGNLKHPNLLPLVAYHSANNDNLLIYRYQKNKSLLHLLDNYLDKKRDFPWLLRVSIAIGIARGLDYIYKKSREEDAPHGNIKLSNILLSENEEPLISEYGFHRYIDPKRAVLYYSNGYRAPEKKLTEKADVFSFGIILLVLLTGKTIERTGIDLPKWVKSMVREEWTGEVFDREVNKSGKQWAFPLLNISLQCISESPENRPHIADVLDKIEELVNGQDDNSFSSISSVESNQQDGCLLHTVIPEGWETPGSNN